MDQEPTGTRDVIPMAAGFEAALAVVALLLGWLLGVDPLATLRGELGAAVWGLVGALPLFALLWLMIRYPRGPLADLLRIVDELVQTMFRNARLRDLAVISLMAGIGEEMLFRGIVQTVLADWTSSPLAGLIGTGILFGLVHSVSRAYAVIAAAVGIYIGCLWLATGNLITPVITHAAYDFGALWYLQRTASERHLH